MCLIFVPSVLELSHILVNSQMVREEQEDVAEKQVIKENSRRHGGSSTYLIVRSHSGEHRRQEERHVAICVRHAASLSYLVEADLSVVVDCRRTRDQTICQVGAEQDFRSSVSLNQHA